MAEAIPAQELLVLLRMHGESCKPQRQLPSWSTAHADAFVGTGRHRMPSRLGQPCNVAVEVTAKLAGLHCTREVLAAQYTQICNHVVPSSTCPHSAAMQPISTTDSVWWPLV
jgi:hypothetical protein